jgi:threonylcarbamoyladenosine tRNA methylthiotransferase MtaB
VEACPEEIADLVVVNSCSVTSDADKDSLYWVRRLRRENPQCRVAFTGCGAGTVPVEADWIIPSEKKSMLLDMISGCFEGGVVNKHEFHEQPIHLLSNRTRAFLKIQDGCDNVCSFCKIRIVRGKSRSRQMADIQEEAERLIASGHKEIVLVGILLGRWGRDLPHSPTLVNVLERLCEQKGLERLRLSSIEPEDVTDELIDFLATHPQMCPHLHMPIQSGDDDILKQMRRAYDAQFYVQRIEKLRSKVKDFCLTTDVMVGFPGETEKQIQNTLALLKQVKPLKVHLFPFSSREGTYAERLPNHLSTQEKRERLRWLDEALQKDIHHIKHSFLKNTFSVIVEEDESRPGLKSGHAPNFLKLYFPDQGQKAGQILPLLLQEPYEDGILCKIAS